MASCLESPASPLPTDSFVGPRFVRPRTVEVWDLPFAAVTMEETLDAIAGMIADQLPRMVITANLNYAMLSSQHADLAAINRQAALVLADGQPIVWRSRCGNAARLPERVAGSQLIYRLGERAADDGWKLYLLGAAPGVAQRCADGLRARYPGCQIVGVDSPPFRALSGAEQQEQLDRIRAASPDVLLVAFGQPKGERWIHQHLEALQVPVSIQIGASFDFVAGTAQRAPVAYQRCGCEWAYRMLKDPRRLVPRYAGNAFFLARQLFRETIEWLAGGPKRSPIRDRRVTSEPPPY